MNTMTYFVRPFFATVLGHVMDGTWQLVLPDQLRCARISEAAGSLWGRRLGLACLRTAERTAAVVGRIVADKPPFARHSLAVVGYIAVAE